MLMIPSFETEAKVCPSQDILNEKTVFLCAPSSWADLTPVRTSQTLIFVFLYAENKSLPEVEKQTF